MTYFYTGFVNDSVTEHFLATLDACKAENHLADVVDKELCTVGGIQTKNVAPKLNVFVLNELVNLINVYVNAYYGRNLEYFRYQISHIHLLEYSPGGHQKKHAHHRTEDHSFIVYLNDSDGATRLYVDEEPIDIKSERNKICIFSSSFLHEGLMCSDKRLLAVGSINFDHKIWK